MAKYGVQFDATASATVYVDVPDDMPEDEIHSYAVDKAYRQGVPTICAQCSGWGDDTFSIDVSEFEIALDDDSNEIPAQLKED